MKPTGNRFRTKPYKRPPPKPPAISTDAGNVIVLSILMTLSAIAGLQVRRVINCDTAYLGTTYHAQQTDIGYSR